MIKKYTEKEDAAIQEMTAQGFKLKDIAAHLERSVKSVTDRRSYLKRHRHGEFMLNENDTLCWICRHATNPENKCPWTGRNKRGEIRFEPVSGWTAEPRKIKYLSSGNLHECDTFIVKKCPLFKRG